MHSSTSVRRSGRAGRFGRNPVRVLARAFSAIAITSVQAGVVLNPHDLLIV